MKDATPELIALLADQNQYVMVDAYEFTLADGTVVTYRDGGNIDGFAINPAEPQAPIL